MRVPEGFKQTEIGVIPQDWDVDEVQNLCAITTGDKNTQDRIIGGLYPFFVRSQIVERIHSYSFDGEAVLTAGDGVGTGKIFHYINGKFDFHQRVYKMSNFSLQLNGYYFFQYFRNNFYNRITKMTAKSSVDSVRKEMIGKMLIPLPPPAEQTAIAAALSDMDALVEGVEKLLEKKRRIKQGAMQELLTGKRRVSGFESQAAFQQTEVGAIPKDWKVAKLDSAGLFLKGRNIPKSELKSEGIPCVLYGEIYTKYNYIEQVIYSRTSKEVANNAFELKKGDVLFAGSGETAEDIGKCFAYQGNERAVAGGDIVILRPNSDFDSSYLGYILNSSSSITQKYFMGQGSSVFHIYPNSLKKLKIPLPPTLAEQTAIAAILSDMDSEIEQLETQLTKYRQLKTGMMQELLTGKKRLV